MLALTWQHCKTVCVADRSNRWQQFDKVLIAVRWGARLHWTQFSCADGAVPALRADELSQLREQQAHLCWLIRAKNSCTGMVLCVLVCPALHAHLM